MTAQNTRFLTVFEVALILRVSKATVYQLVHAGDLEAIRVGRTFRIPVQAITPQPPSVPRDA
jgi:excisionase family DNA binding protein